MVLGDGCRRLYGRGATRRLRTRWSNSEATKVAAAPSQNQRRRRAGFVPLDWAKGSSRLIARSSPAPRPLAPSSPTTPSSTRAPAPSRRHPAAARPRSASRHRRERQTRNPGSTHADAEQPIAAESRPREVHQRDAPQTGAAPDAVKPRKRAPVTRSADVPENRLRAASFGGSLCYPASGCQRR